MTGNNSLSSSGNDPWEVTLELPPEAMRKAGYRVVDFLVDRIVNLPESLFGAELSREQTERLLREEMPENPQDFEEVFGEYLSKVVPNFRQVDHPRFFAFIPSSPTFPSILADALVSGTNIFAGTWFEASGPSQIELLVIDWFKKMLGLPPEAGGLFVSGGSVANLHALTVARKFMLKDRLQRSTIYCTAHAHACFDRSFYVLGFKPNQIRRVPTDEAFRMDVGRLSEMVRRDRRAGKRPFLVIASAGTTNVGAIDPLEDIAAIALRESLWFHVDAAYGGFAAMTKRGAKLLQGIEQADSVVLDPHKWLYCPFEAGCVIVRDHSQLKETFHILPEYMRDTVRKDSEINFCDYGLQLTRGFRALKVWMSLKTFGAERIRRVIDQCMDLAGYGAEHFAESPNLQIVTRPSLGIFTFRYVPTRLSLGDPRDEAYLNRLNQTLIARIIAGRELMLSSTVLGEKHILRFCVLNYRSRRQDIQEARLIIERLGRAIDREMLKD
jgi:aromatic-L-amino-acid/L-tryptophan decarboxylase